MLFFIMGQLAQSSLYSSNWPQSLSNPILAFQVLGLKVWDIMPSLNQDLLLYYLLILHPYHSLPSFLSSHSPSIFARNGAGLPWVQQSMAYQAHPLRSSWTRQSRTRKVYSLCVSVCTCMSLCVCITCTQVIKDIGGCRIPETGVTGIC